MIPENIPSEVTTAYEASNEAGMTKEELEIQYNKQQYIAIQMGSITQATQKGIELGIDKGIEIGVEQGIEKSKKEIAMKLIEQGIALETIALVSEISIEQLHSLKGES